ncbi:protein NRT1/ PTR FAMILY 4.1-like [Magnolia sinica]|uniref:protein NRT1/ PTR FAMILY 4.1-like n=1 Tax=Magnolia sinica TaxID=86752 RepID=UPI002657C093|nr:protein NRT1/ PTR FAMILY 4.1-like [Magnolia sinica]
MDMEQEMNIEREEYVDWKGREVQPAKHHGTRGATFVCVVEVLENMVFLSIASNLVTYFHYSMHYPLGKSSNMLTNYMATSFLLTLLGAFISDTFLTRFCTMVLFGSIELTGLVTLTIQAHYKALQPPPGRRPSPPQAIMLYAGLYAMAAGVGGVKASLPAHGADQLDRSNKKLVSTFFNWYFFSLCMGGLSAVTILVWIQENRGWQWGFGISAGALCLALLVFAIGFPFYRHKIPSGSPLTRIFKVFLSTIRHWNTPAPVTNGHGLEGRSKRKFRQEFHFPFLFFCMFSTFLWWTHRFLDKATMDDGISRTQVEETRSFLRLLPIFASTIMMNCCLAQLQTFSVHQGMTMDQKLFGNFQIPPASLTAIPLIIMLVLVALYERLIIVMARKLLQKDFVYPPLQRIGLGLVLASMSMAVAAIVEIKRRAAAEESVTISIFWLGWQYFLLGMSDMFTLAGMMEFFYSEAPSTMRSVCTALSWCSTAMGYFLSSLLVWIANSVSGRFGSGEWLGGNDLNSSRLDLFYALLSVMNFVNFLNYLFWARWY